MQFVETFVTEGNCFYERWTATDIMQPHNLENLDPSLSRMYV